MTFQKFQVFGQRCSGTNALVRLLSANFPELKFCEQTGFKHWFVPDDRSIPNDTIIVVIARELSEWLHSLHRQPWHAHPAIKDLSFGKFIRSEWHSIWDEDFWGIDEGHPRFGTPIREEMCPASGRPFANVIAKRTAKLQNWLSLSGRSRAFVAVNHDQLIMSPQDIISKVAAAADCKPRANFVPVVTYKGQGNIAFVRKTYPALTPEDRIFVGDFVDAKAELAFGLPVIA